MNRISDGLRINGYRPGATLFIRKNKAVLFCVICVICVPFSFTRCMSDDLSGCLPPANVILHLNYPETAIPLAGYLSAADLYLFDEEDRLASIYSLSTRELEEEVVSLWVEPGHYRVVSWGNTAPASPLSGGTAFSEAVLLHDSPQLASAFYAPAQPAPEEGAEYHSFTLDVPQKGEIEETIDFMPSHREITVTVTGYTDLVGTANLAPVVEITHLPAGYSFKLATMEEMKKYKLQTVYSAAEPESAYATLYTPFAAVNNETTLTLRRASDNHIITEHNLKALLQSKGAEPGYTGPIRITFGFMTGEMEITLPGWNIHPTIP